MDRQSEFLTLHLPRPLLSVSPLSLSLSVSVSVCLSARLSLFRSQVYLATGPRPPHDIFWKTTLIRLNAREKAAAQRSGNSVTFLKFEDDDYE